MKVRPFGAELFHGQKDGHTDRQTDMEKLIVAFRNFSNEPNKQMNKRDHSWAARTRDKQ